MTFEKGKSGNPAGRPKGVGTHARLRAALAEMLPDATKALHDGVKAGDPAMSRIYWDRVHPALRAEAARLEFEVPEGGLMEQAKAALAAAARGEISVDAAAIYVSAIASAVAIEQGTELRDQLALLMSERFGDIA